MTFKEIAKLLETNIQTIPNLIAVLKKGFEEADSGSSEHQYSTDEQIIGKWIDGTTNVYEKIIQFTSAASDTQIIDLSSLNIDKLISIDGVIDGGTIQVPLNFYNGSNNYLNAFYIHDENNNGIQFTVNASWAGNKSAFAIIRYTKTTT